MKARILKTFIPTLAGILVVLGMLILYNLIFEHKGLFNANDIDFYTIFLPFATLGALIIQYGITLPIWGKFKFKGKLLSLNLFQFTALVSMISGFIFGIFFWEKGAGLGDLMGGILSGIIAFGIYWTFNLWVLKKMDRV